MVALGPLAVDDDIVTLLFRDPDGSVRSALMCWSIALAALAMLRVPRQVMLACLLIASVTVGLASVMIEAGSARVAVAAAKPTPSATSHRSPPVRSAAPDRGSLTD